MRERGEKRANPTELFPERREIEWARMLRDERTPAET